MNSAKNINIPKFNWIVYFALVIIVRLVFMQLTMLEFFGVALFLHQVCHLVVFSSHILPIRYLFGSFLSLELLVGPIFNYHGLNFYVMYKQWVPSDLYYSYVIPAVVSFIIGLSIFSKKHNGEIPNVGLIREFVSRDPKMPYYMIAMGFFTSLISPFFPSELAFFLYILGGLKFIGLFLLILGGVRLKGWVLILVYSSVLMSSLQQAMFHDLVSWMMFLGAVLANRYRFSMATKLTGVASFLLLILFIQMIKSEFRAATWGGDKEGDFSTLYETAQIAEDQGGLFSEAKLALLVARINQGWIVGRVMYMVPTFVPFSDGEDMSKIIRSAILPRILAPDKMNSGKDNKDIFRKYTGLQLNAQTSMSLGYTADAYVNFGIVGGCIFMFCLGSLFNFFLKRVHYLAKWYPLLPIFIPLVFYYPIRVDTASQTSLGHFFKTILVIYILFKIFKKKVYVKPSKFRAIQQMPVSLEA